jgi:hypothetical protein
MSKNEEDYIIVTCPHCSDFIYINKKEFNCHIFRHGVLKENNIQINPHLPKIECDQLFNDGLIYGCGKPFQIVALEAIICDYI